MCRGKRSHYKIGTSPSIQPPCNALVDPPVSRRPCDANNSTHSITHRTHRSRFPFPDCVVSFPIQFVEFSIQGSTTNDPCRRGLFPKDCFEHHHCGIMTSRSTCRLSMMVALAAALRATAGFGSMMAVAAGESRPINPRFLTATDSFSTSHRGLLQRTRRHAYAEDATVMYARRDKTYLERSSEAEDDCDDGPILAVRALLQVRGGGGTGIGSGLSRLSEYIAASRSRSWTVLFLSILTDTVATTLMKTARKESSTPKLVVAFCGYFIR